MIAGAFRAWQSYNTAVRVSIETLTMEIVKQVAESKATADSVEAISVV